MITFNEEKHEYYYDGIRVPSVHEIMEHGRFISEWKPPEDILRRGQVVHWLTEVFDKERNYDLVPPELTPYLQGYEGFLEEYRPEVIESEKIVFHESLFYAGTLDRVYDIQGAAVVTDIKTGGFSKWHKMQITAYMMALPKAAYDTACLYLTSNGLYDLKSFRPKYFDMFEAACLTYWFSRETDYGRLAEMVRGNK